MKKNDAYMLAGSILIILGLLLTGYNIFLESSAVEVSKGVLDKLVIKRKNINNTVFSEDLIKEYNLDVVDREIDIPDYILNPNMDMPIVEIAGYNYIGVIEIPSLGKMLPVINGCDYNNLKLSPCVYSGTAYLNNFVIVARNYKSYFGGIAKLPFGEKIIFRDVDGNLFNYSIVEKISVEDNTLEELNLEDSDLTLVTSSAGGMANMVLRCEKLD